MAVNATKTEGAAAAPGVDAPEVAALEVAVPGTDTPAAHAHGVTLEVAPAPQTASSVAPSETVAAVTVSVSPLEAASGTAPSAAATAYAQLRLQRQVREQELLARLGAERPVCDLVEDIEQAPLYLDKLTRQIEVLLRSHYYQINGSAALGSGQGRAQLTLPELRALSIVTMLLLAYAHDLGKLKLSFEVRADNGRTWNPESCTLEQFLNQEQPHLVSFYSKDNCGIDHGQQPLLQGLALLHHHVPAAYDYLSRFFDLTALGSAVRAADATPGAVSSDGSELFAQLITRADRMAVALSTGQSLDNAPLTLVAMLKHFLALRAQLQPDSINGRYSDVYFSGTKLLLVQDSLALDSCRRLVGAATGTNHRTFEHLLHQEGLGNGYTWCRIITGSDLIYAYGTLLELSPSDSAEIQALLGPTASELWLEPQLRPDYQRRALTYALAHYAWAVAAAGAQGSGGKVSGPWVPPGVAPDTPTAALLALDLSQIEILGRAPESVAALLKAKVTPENLGQSEEPFRRMPQHLVVVGGASIIMSGGRLRDYALQFCFEQDDTPDNMQDDTPQQA